MFKPPRVFLMLSKAHTALARVADRRTRDVAGLSVTQHGMLFLLERQNGLTVSALAQALSVQISSLSGLVDRMEASGLVRRERGDGDGRVVRIFLEDSARDLLTRTRPMVQDMNRALLAPFDEAEQQVITRFLEHVAENAEAIVKQV